MKPRAFVLLACLAVLPLILSSVATPFPETLRSFSIETFKPVFQTSDFFSHHVSGAFTKVWDLFFVYKQNEELKTQVSSLKMELAALREERGQLRRLERLLQYLDHPNRKAALARIIFRGISFWERNVLIDKGTRHGVEKDFAVVTDQGLVGKILSSNASSAQVILIVDSSSRVSVVDQETRDAGLVEGTGSQLLRMTYIDLAATIKVGDTVVTSGLGGVYPRGIPVGKVESVEKDKEGLHLLAHVRAFTDFSKLEEVLCLARTNRER